MTDRKDCSKCHQTKYIDEFDEGKLCCKNVMNIEKSIAKNVEINTTRNKGKDMKKMKSIEKRNRNKIQNQEIQLLPVMFVINQ